MVGRELARGGAPDAAPMPAPRSVLSVRGPDAGRPRDRGGWRRVLDGVGFDVRAGEVLGIAGLLGAGRTEMLETIFGVARRASAGGAIRHRRRAGRRSARRATRAGSGWRWSPRTARRTGLTSATSIATTSPCRCSAALARFGLRAFGARGGAGARRRSTLGIRCSGIEQAVGTLSGGNQQKVVHRQVAGDGAARAAARRADPRHRRRRQARDLRADLASWRAQRAGHRGGQLGDAGAAAAGGPDPGDVRGPADRACCDRERRRAQERDHASWRRRGCGARTATAALAWALPAGCSPAPSSTGGSARSVLVGVLLSPVTSRGNNIFLVLGNLLDVLRQVSITGIVAVGMTLVILTGGIDLSVGSVLAFGSVVCAMLLTSRAGPPAAVMGVPAIAARGARRRCSRSCASCSPMLAQGAARGEHRRDAASAPPWRLCAGRGRRRSLAARWRSGAWCRQVPSQVRRARRAARGALRRPAGRRASTALIIVDGRLQPFIVTLAMMVRRSGVARLTAGQDKRCCRSIPAPTRPPTSSAAGAAVRRAADARACSSSRRSCCSGACCGSRRSAATSTPSAATRRRRGCRASPSGRVKIATYALSGMLAGLAGVLYVAQYRQGKPDAGAGLELDAIAAVVIGGTSLMGGHGGLAGTLLRRADLRPAQQHPAAPQHQSQHPARAQGRDHHRRGAAAGAQCRRPLGLSAPAAAPLGAPERPPLERTRREHRLEPSEETRHETP